MLQDMTELPQKPHMLQHWPNLEPAQVWPPFLEPHRPAELTLDVDVGFVAEAVEVLEVFTVEEVAMLEGADDTLTVELVSVDPPAVAPVVAAVVVTWEVPQVPKAELHPVPQ